VESTRPLSASRRLVRGTAHEQSDLDFVVEFERKPFDADMDLKAYLENLFGCRVAEYDPRRSSACPGTLGFIWRTSSRPSRGSNATRRDGIDIDIVWDVVQTKLPDLRAAVRSILDH
jgi:hypothetical protein